jgi:hypothetical protein
MQPNTAQSLHIRVGGYLIPIIPNSNLLFILSCTVHVLVRGAPTFAVHASNYRFYAIKENKFNFIE